MRRGPALLAADQLRQIQGELDESQHPEWYARLETLNNERFKIMAPLWDHMNTMDMPEIERLQRGCMAEPLENGCMSEKLQKEYMTEELQR